MSDYEFAMSPDYWMVVFKGQPVGTISKQRGAFQFNDFHQLPGYAASMTTALSVQRHGPEDVKAWLVKYYARKAEFAQ